MLKDSVPALLSHATELFEAEFRSLPPFEPAYDQAAATRVLEDVAHRLGDNYPYFHPLYAGQMLKPPHPVARAAYALAMNINPNNHSREGGRASADMEVECVAHIAAMFGWKKYQGHLTTSGTLANMESLWISGQCAPNKRIIGSEQAHFTHSRISGVLQLEYTSVPSDKDARINMNALEEELRKGDVGTVVVAMGTTGMGAVDPLDEIIALREKYGFRVHVDGAYGGYFKLIADALDPAAKRAYDSLKYVDSIAIDPHKHGLQPYGCGCVLFGDSGGIRDFYKHDSPYTYLLSNKLQLGEISLECSRAGSAAVALWATHQLLPLIPGGEFARNLEKSRAAAKELHRRLQQDQYADEMPGGPSLDIVVWRPQAKSFEDASRLSREIFDACAKRNLDLSLFQIPARWFDPMAEGHITGLRSVLMKPEHADWMDVIWEKLSAATAEVMQQ